VGLESLKDAYWAIVTDCLVQFHQHSPQAARELSLELRDVIESPRHQDAPPPGYDSRLFYHGEPFHVACDLAGRGLDLDRHRAAYDELVTRHYAAAEELRPSASYPAREYAEL
jgi:hypothetical protein